MQCTKNVPKQAVVNHTRHQKLGLVIFGQHTETIKQLNSIRKKATLT